MATVAFDVTNLPRKISMLTPLVGSSGTLRLEKLTLDSDAREEFLLFTAMDDNGKNLDQKVAQRLLDAPGTVLETHTPLVLDEAVHARLTTDCDLLCQSTLNRASEAGNGRYRIAQQQLNRWADDKIEAAELKLTQIRTQITQANREVDLATNLDQRRMATEKVEQLIAQRRRARSNIDDVEDEVEAQRKDLLRQLQQRCQQKHNSDELFTIRYQVI